MVLHGIDTASYQAGIGKVASDFRIIKATEGTGYTNPALQGQIATAPALKGFYHFASNGNVEAEANHFINTIRGYIGSAILVLDYEPKYPSVSWAKAWLETVYKKTGVRPLIYLGLSVENNYNWSSVAAENFGLWVAQYNNYNVVSGFNPRNIYGSVKHWKSNAIFQYTSTGRLPGWGGNLDFNVFYGDKAAWQKYAAKNGKVSAPVSAPKPAAKPASKPASNGAKWVSQNVTYKLKTAVNLRSSASTSGGIIATLPAGSIVKTDAAIITGGYRWVRQPRSGGYGYLVTGPAGDTLAYVSTVSGGAKASAPVTRYYTVISGDTLSGIGAKLGIGWGTLASKNGIRAPYVIYPGQRLKY